MKSFKKLVANERGVVLVISLLILALLIGAGVGAIVSMQTDLRISSNLKTATQALYIAEAGIERGKKSLIENIGSLTFPTTINENFATGSFSVTITDLGSGRYSITSQGLGLANSKREIEAVMSQPDFTPLGAINIDGDGTHADFDDGSGGTGRKIPSFSVDGRNHTADGSALSAACADLSPFAGTESGANTDITDAEDDLKKGIVKRANAFCPGSDCTPGLNYVADLGLTDKNNDCPGSQCYKNLDLTDPRLRATAVDASTSPPTYFVPSAPDDRGPFAGGSSLVNQLNSTQTAELQQAIQDLIEISNNSPASKKICLDADIRGGTRTFGTPSDPKITYILKTCPADNNPTYDPANPGAGADLDIEDGAVVDGAGILIVPKRLRILDAVFNWQGIVLVLQDGDFRVEGGSGSNNSCGSINGTVVLQDDAGNDPKLDFDKVKDGGCTSPNKPFSVNLSCDAVNNALQTLIKQVSWVEKF